MKLKLVGMLVCMLLIATMAIPISALNKEYDPNPPPISNDADVPVWEVGDSWTYEMYFFQNGDENESYSFELSGVVTFEVIDDAGDTYIVSGSTDDFEFVIHIGSIVLKPTRFMDLGMELKLRKSDLAFESWHQYTKGIYLPWLGPIPLPIPIQLEADQKTTLEPSWSIMPFPLSDGKTGTLDGVEFTDIGKTALYWGLLPIYDGEKSWDLPGLNYTCNEEQVTVPSGTYAAYNVSAEYEDYENFISYYVEEIGNSVKELVHISFENHITYWHMELELISTTYEP